MIIGKRLAGLHGWLIPSESGQGWAAYLWLAYLSFFFIEWGFRPFAAWELPLMVLTVAVFLFLYFSAFRRRGRWALVHIAAIALLGVAWAGNSAGSSVFFIYAASFAYQVGPPRVSILVVAAVVALAGLTAWLAQPMLFYWLPGVAISIIIGAANIFFGEQRRRDAELRLSQAEVKRLAKVAERERIARDLHDVIGHTLSLIVVKSALASRLIEQDPDQAKTEIQSIEATARSSLQEVRTAISGLREQSLEEALDQASLAMRSADIELQMDVDEELNLPARDAAMLGLVIREACTNVIRHADARHCRISLHRDGSNSKLLLDISDDGGGHIRADGSGIQGMRARLESLGGELHLDTKRGGHLQGWVPLSACTTATTT